MSTIGRKRKLLNKNIVRLSILCVLMFMFLYSIPVIGSIGYITSTRVAVVIFFVWGIASQKRFFTIKVRNIKSEMNFIEYWLLTLFLLVYTFLLLLIQGTGTGETVTNVFLNILVFSAMVFYGMKTVFADANEAMKVLLIVSLLQSIVVIIGLFYKPFEVFIDETFNASLFWMVEGRMYEMKVSGYASGIACFTSKGSQKLSLGIIACAYFLMKEKKEMRYIVLTLIITFASAAVSRIGLVFTVVIFMYMLVATMKKNAKKSLNIFAKSIVTMIALMLCVYIFNLQDYLIEIFNRLIILAHGGFGSFFDAYFHGEGTAIPPLSVNTIVGLGIWSGRSGTGILVNADGGFIRTYAALGLIFAMVYYIFLFKLYLSGLRGMNGHLRSTYVIFGIFIIIGEFKEPLLYDWYYQTLLFVFMALAKKHGGIHAGHLIN